MSQVDALLDSIAARMPMQRALIEPLRSGGLDRKDLGRYLEYAASEGHALDELVDSYQRIVDDTMREQLFFLRNNRYRYQSFEEVADHVYFDAGYMRLYMHGLALTSFLWQNHAAMRRHLVATLEGVSNRAEKRYLEVGPGHGFYMAAAAELGFAHVEGVDISPTSIALTRSILQSTTYGPKPHTLTNADLLKAEFEHTYDVIVMGEVLEHVEQPGVFLARLRELAAPGATIYVTTCANSPAVDHIYCFRSVAEVIALAAENGLKTTETFALPYPGTTLAESENKRLAVNVALVLAA